MNALGCALRTSVNVGVALTRLPLHVRVATKVLLFVLVAGLSATVDLQLMWRNRWRFPRGIAATLTCQFLLLPLLGFAAVRAFNLRRVEGVMLIVLTSSPGGTFSNWWCSVLNGDLALSVAATAISNVVAIATLPANVILYLGASYGTEVRTHQHY